MTKLRVLLALLTLILVGTFATLITLYAKGYRFDKKSFRFRPSGLLVLKSDPVGASVYINGELITATDNTISLSPGAYDVSIKKEGYHAWEKRLIVEKEIVTEAGASLFKVAPSLSAITFSSVVNPVLAPDGSKIAYLVLPENGITSEASGLWVLETVNLPVGFAKEPRKITDGDLTDATYIFSPDGRQILLTVKTGVFLLDSGTLTSQSKRVNIASRKDIVLADWQKQKQNRLLAQLKPLPDELEDILTRKASVVLFSPDENKIVYTASGAASIKKELIRPLPGSSTQREERDIKMGRTYVYDIKEDRNFLIDDGAEPLILNQQVFPEGALRRASWFPTSKHLVLAEGNKISIMDYDGTNRQEVYTGSYVAPHAYPFASTSRLLILTNLGATDSLPNLYSISLK